MPKVTQNVTLMVKNGHVVADPTKIPDTMIGDKLRFDSKDGKFEVVFDRWIFSGKDHPITDRRARTIRHRGLYNGECSITAPSGQGKMIVYDHEKDSGAHGNVRP